MRIGARRNGQSDAHRQRSIVNDATTPELEALKSAGVVGVAWNATFHGTDYYAGATALLERLAALDMFIDVQVEHDQLLALMPMLERSPARVLVDHCGRPNPAASVDQPGFRALRKLGESGRAYVKLSGYTKCSRDAPPHDDARPFIDALVASFTPDRCLWASDWPFLRAPARIDVGPLLTLVERFVPNGADRRKVLWETPRRVLGFG